PRGAGAGRPQGRISGGAVARHEAEADGGDGAPPSPGGPATRRAVDGARSGGDAPHERPHPRDGAERRGGDPFLAHAAPRGGAVPPRGDRRRGEDGARGHARRDPRRASRGGTRRPRVDFPPGRRRGRNGLIGVLLRLQALTLRGRVVRSLRLLRQPKYLVGSIAGALWMAGWIARPI